MPAEFVADEARSEGQWAGKEDEDTENHSNQVDFRSHQNDLLSDWVDLHHEQVKKTKYLLFKLNIRAKHNWNMQKHAETNKSTGHKESSVKAYRQAIL